MFLSSVLVGKLIGITFLKGSLYQNVKYIQHCIKLAHFEKLAWGKNCTKANSQAQKGFLSGESNRGWSCRHSYHATTKAVLKATLRAKVEVLLKALPSLFVCVLVYKHFLVSLVSITARKGFSPSSKSTVTHLWDFLRLLCALSNCTRILMLCLQQWDTASLREAF